MTKKHIQIFSLVLIIIYPLLFIWQGLDLTDMGYNLCGFQNFISHPEGMEFLFINWGTYAIGWLLSLVSFDLGIIFFRIAIVILFWLVIYLVYILISEHLPDSHQWLLLPIFFITQAYILRDSEDWLGYNTCTSIFLVISTFLFYRGLTKKSLFILYLSGIISGFNCYVRFPNIIGLFMGLIIYQYGYLAKEKCKVIFYNFLFYYLGVLSVIIIVTLIMKLSGHLGMYLSNFKFLSELAVSNSSSYRLENLISLFVYDHVQVLIWSIFFMIFILLLALLIRRFQTQTKIVAIFIVSIAFYPVMWKLKWSFTGVLYLIHLYGFLINRHKNIPLSLLYILSLFILIIAPLGSNNGISQSFFGAWLAIPLALIFFIHLVEPDQYAKKNTILRKFFSNDTIKCVCLILFGMIFFISVYSKIICPYGDANRWQLLTSVDYQFSTGIYTSEKRSKAVRECLIALREFAGHDSVVLGYNGVPTIHYLSHTIPYLGNPWPLMFSPEKLSQILNQKSSKNMPEIIFRATVNTGDRFWPRSSESGNIANLPPNRSRQILDEFCRVHNYKTVWKNNCFEILKRDLAFK